MGMDKDKTVRRKRKCIVTKYDGMHRKIAEDEIFDNGRGYLLRIFSDK